MARSTDCRTSESCDKGILIAFVGLVFVLSFIWFRWVHPLVPYFADDWKYMAYVRQPIPMSGAWNPTRVFPETFMMVPAQVAAHVIMPFTHDFIDALLLAYALTAAVFIAAYMYAFALTIRRLFDLSVARVLLCTLLFFIMHFSVFKVSQKNNLYMFWSQNSTCFFFYTLSGVLNSIVVLYFCRNGVNESFRQDNIAVVGTLALIVYLCINSNMYLSNILVIYTGVDLLVRLCFAIREKTALKRVVLDNLVSFIIIIAWLVSIWFEANGGRANSLTGDGLRKAAKAFFKWRLSLNIPTLIVLITALLGSVFTWLGKKRRDALDYNFIVLLIKLVTCFLLACLYLILLASRTGSNKLWRAEVIFSAPFYMLLMGAVCLAYILKNFKKASIVLPLAIYLLLFYAANGTHCFRESIKFNIAPSKAIPIGKYMVSQIVEAAERGDEEVGMIVPQGKPKSNSPHSRWMTDELSKNMVRLGLIDYNIKINIVPDPEMNERYNLPY